MGILDFLFPKRCVGCGRLGKYFCDYCRGKIRYIAANESICPVCEKPAMDGATHPKCRTRYGLDGLMSFFRYDGPVRKAIKSLKYRFVSDLASEFVAFVDLDVLPFRYGVMKPYDRAVFIPIPLHWSRLRERGFNQAEILGRLIAEKLRLTVRMDILYRVKKTTPQVAMKHRKDRLANMDKVFSIRNSQFSIGNSTVLLFDDVFTTGATMRAAANTLKRAGVKHVWAVTMAR